MFRSKKLLASVKDFDCQVCGKYGQTVPAHANWQEYGKGMGLKAHDMYVAAVCTHCHDMIDGRIGKLTEDEKRELWHRAWVRTVYLWFEHGVIK
jgi:transcription elongation factor Elf1